MAGIFGSKFTGGRMAGDQVWIELPNADQVIGRINQDAAGLEYKTDRIIALLADEMVTVAKELVATDTHKTQDSIRKEKRSDGWYIVVDRFGDKPEVPIYLEIGTWKMAARPFLVPASNLVLSSGGLLRASKQVGGLLGQTPGRKG